MTIEQIKKIHALGYNVYYCNNSTMLKLSDIIDDYYFFEVEIYESFTGQKYLHPLNLMFLSYVERKKIYTDDSFINDAIIELENKKQISDNFLSTF